MLEKTERAFKNGQSIDIDNIGHEDKQNKKHNTENRNIIRAG